MPKKQNKKKAAKRDSQNESQEEAENKPGTCSISSIRCPEQRETSVPMVVNINCSTIGNIQVGDKNVMLTQSQAECTHLSTDIDGAPNWSDKQNKSYAEAVLGTTRVNIGTKDEMQKSYHANTTPVQETQVDSKQSNKSNIDLFLEKVHNFERGHFVLVTGEQSVLKGIDALAHINWTAVFDFDPHSRSKGILSRLEPIISKLRSLHVCSIQDSFTDTFSEPKTNWVFFRGCTYRPGTRLADDFDEWKKLSYEHIENKLKLLKQFEVAYTCFTFIVIWPTNDESVQYMHSVLNRICTLLKSTVLILDNDKVNSELSERKLKDLNDNKEVSVIKLGMLDMCTGCSSVIKTLENEEHSKSLPTKEGHIRITDDKAQWLKEDLHVLYLNNTQRVRLSVEELAKLEDDFRKGGTLTWDWLYAGGAGHADIPRDGMPNILRRLKNMYISRREPGQVTIIHEPGAGGTTLGRKLLWELKEDTPCVEINHDFDSHITDQIEKLAFLSDMTNSPIVALIDGDDEIRVKTLRNRAKQVDGLCLIVLYLRRTTLNDHGVLPRNDFYLKGQLSKSEASMLELKCKKNEMDEVRLHNVRKLVYDVENGEQRTIFEFGLAAHSFEYEGIKSYVLSYLKLKPVSSEVENWQKALAYISLVYFYGHSPMPCHFFTGMLTGTGEQSVLQVDDFPPEMHELIVPVENRKFVRISHFYVAKEILEQILLRMRPDMGRPLSPYLCNEARRLLGGFSTQFISNAVSRNNGNVSDVMTRMMINTFIKRDTKELPDDETTERRKEGACKPMFSNILEDAGPNPPYSERLDILQALADGFPAVPELRAHLGRFYMLCRPENETEAEKHFATAFEKTTDMSRKLNEMTYTKRNEIRNICHMYGKMMSRKVFKYTGRSAYDKPLIPTNETQFKARAVELHKNVSKACELFEKCREICSQGYEECNGYMDEIHVRLAYCRFIQENKPSTECSLPEMSDDVAQFIEECDRTVIALFDEMYDISECQINDKVNRLRAMYKKVMCSQDTHLRVPSSPQDNPASRRSEIVVIKHPYFDKRSSKYLVKLRDEDIINRIVTLCEKNFETCSENDTSVDIDYKEWMKAIRHPVYQGQETVERVYRQVQYWYDRMAQNCTGNKDKQTVALFYHFALSCLLGFGSIENPGNVNLLKQALRLMDDVKFTARSSHNGDCRREWLGIPGTFKQRLVEGNKWTSPTVDVPEEGLEIRVGTILHPNNRDSSGYIDMFVGEANKESVRVYYIPVKWGTNGRSYVGTRVQFVVQFNMKHGLEAFHVKQVLHTECETVGCGNNIETRSSDKEVTCGNCLKKTPVQS